MNKIIEVIPNELFQSGSLFSEDWETLVEKKIVVVVNLRHHEEDDLFNPPYPHMYLHAPLFDRPVLPDVRELDALSDFLVTCIHRGLPVLCHCKQGHNRSMLLVGCVLHKLGMSGPNILKKLRSLRPDALQNETFAEYIKALA